MRDALCAKTYSHVIRLTESQAAWRVHSFHLAALKQKQSAIKYSYLLFIKNSMCRCVLINRKKTINRKNKSKKQLCALHMYLFCTVILMYATPSNKTMAKRPVSTLTFFLLGRSKNAKRNYLDASHFLTSTEEKNEIK